MVKEAHNQKDKKLILLTKLLYVVLESSTNHFIDYYKKNTQICIRSIFSTSFYYYLVICLTMLANLLFITYITKKNWWWQSLHTTHLFFCHLESRQHYSVLYLIYQKQAYWFAIYHLLYKDKLSNLTQSFVFAGDNLHSLYSLITKKRKPPKASIYLLSDTF